MKKNSNKKPCRGSRKHVLDWTSLDKSEFLSSLNQLLEPSRSIVSPGDHWMPRGEKEPTEAKLHELGSEYLPKEIAQSLDNWWLKHKRGANRPNWDFLSTCTINGKKGLVMVEAKANCAELKLEGKKLSVPTQNSKENHEKISEAIEESRQALARIIPGVEISRDKNYQLSNRVAYAWKLASLGIPTVLVYLGFLGDDNIKDVGEPLLDESHWKRVFGDYMKGVLPEEFLEKSIECGKASMRMFIRSRKIIESSRLCPC